MPRTTIPTVASLLVSGLLLTTQPGVGCVDTTTTTDGHTTKHRQIDDNDTGTSTTDPNYILRRAAIVAEGRGPLEYTADADGVLYVQDLKNEITVVMHRVHRGEKVTVVPDDNRVRLEEDSIYKGDLKKDHVHRLYLLRDSRFDDNRRGDPRNDSRGNTPYASDNININDRDVGPYNERGVPAKARIMDQGMNREMTFVSDQSGRVYIFDVKHAQVAATVDLTGQQVFKFSPGIDRVTVDGRRVPSNDFDPTSQYRIYFYH